MIYKPKKTLQFTLTILIILITDVTKLEHLSNMIITRSITLHMSAVNFQVSWCPHTHTHTQTELNNFYLKLHMTLNQTLLISIIVLNFNKCWQIDNWYQMACKWIHSVWKWSVYKMFSHNKVNLTKKKLYK